MRLRGGKRSGGDGAPGPAKEYHQDYLEKNPGGYCRVDRSVVATEPLD